MRIIELEEIRLLKQSEKSMVLLVREMDGEQLYVQKTLQGRHEIYGTLQSISHPHLPNIHEVTISDDVTVVLEEYIDGQTLDSAALTEKQVCTAIKELCAVLGFLHEKGIIHRDVKPSNIILASDGHIRLIDFDIARMIKDDLEQDTRLLGTRGYAPPEQFGFAQTDARADIYSLGVTIKQLLSEKAKKARYKWIIRKCTSLNPNKRYRSVKAVRKALSFHCRGLVYISATILMALLSWCITLWIPSSTTVPEVLTQESYPEEDLLFYVKNGNYIIQSSDDAFENKSEHMQVDMTGKGDYSDFILPYSLYGFIAHNEEFNMAFYIDPLADGLAPSFWIDGAQESPWSLLDDNVYHKIAYDSSVLTRSLTQITCADADGDGIKELFVSKGNREDAILTMVWRLTDVKKKRYDLVGSMWGTSVMHLYSNGDIRALVNIDQLNHYNYADGALTELSVVDYETFKYDQAVKSDYADWTYDDITRGYRLEEASEDVKDGSAESFPENGYNSE